MINFKRFVSGILSLVMMLVMFESIPVYAKTGTETYTYEGYTVEYIVSNEWTGNQSVEVKITNTGEESILNWALKYDAKGEISGLWNAVSVSDEETVCLIKNSGYNYEIAPNESVTFGYTLSGENLSVPEKFELCSKRVDTKEENYTAVLDITEEWDTGFKAELIVSNVSDSPLEAWQFSFDSNFSVSDIWNCRLLENTDGRYTVASEAWVNPIQPGSSVIIGIVGIKEEGKAPEISGVTLSEVVIDDTLPEVQKPVGEMFIAAFGEYIKETETIDILWMSTQTEGTFEILMSDDNEEYTVAGSVQNADNYSIPADFVKKYIKVRQTNGNQTAESEPFVVMMTPTGYTVDFIDSDNDGLYDYIEDAVGTDKNLSDTDNDDLTDYEEVYLLGTDPVVYDSIVSGTSDGDADPDNDGLSNRYELDNGTNPLCDDTDDDGLKDGEEVNTYGTNPLEPDTDFDGLEDSDEIYLGTDPTLPDTDNDGILDCDERFNQTFTHIVENEDCVVEEVIVSMEGTGNLQTNTTIESVMDKDVLCSEVVGLVGEPFSIETTSQFDIASLTFKIDQSKLGDTEFDNLMFLWYDEENYKFVELETFYDYENSTVSIETTHFSRYMIVDKFKWFEAWSVEFNYRPTDGGCKSNDTIITIDCSGSMYNYDTTGINSKRAQAASNFFDTMRDGDRAGVVTFTNSAEVTCNLTDSQTDLANGLDNIYSSGGTSFRAALNTALTVFDEDDTLPINKRIILLSDGQDSVPYAVLDECNERNVVVYTIGLGSSSDSILETIATYTGGEFFKAYTADELLDIYSDIGITSDFDTTDTDGDGLYDVVESAGIRLQNGKIINTDPTNSDSDDDGLSDGKEIDPKIRQFYVPGMPSDVAALQPYYFVERSDPLSVDGDGDGYLDCLTNVFENSQYKVDPRPLKNDVKIYQLTPDYFEIANIPAEYGTANWYGGYQGVFDDVTTANNGCTIISSIDALLFLSYFNNSIHNSDDEICGLNGTDGQYYFEYESYKEYAEKFVSRYGKSITANSLASNINEYSEENGLNIKAFFVDNSGKSKLLLTEQKIENQIRNNIPVPIIRAGRTRIDMYNVDGGKYMFKNITSDIPLPIGFYKDNYWKGAEKGGHCFNATGIVYDDVQNKTLLIVSNWGSKAVNDFDDLKNSSFMSGYIMITKTGDNDHEKNS